ncbi:MAG: hypothetical protein WCT03_03560 [Candidatus Obscuribacterales bacterium]|jgi:hypothetical protein
MPRQEQVKTLLTKMKAAVSPDSLHRRLDLAPYKSSQAWPGKPFLLVGNSYNTEKRVRGSAQKRASAIAALLQDSHGTYGKKHCLTLKDALANQRFVDTLSRFEADWLRREPATTLIGPAYDDEGNLLKDSFAVWRRLQPTKAPLSVPAGSR